jgi:hypothetical protein
LIDHSFFPRLGLLDLYYFRKPPADLQVCLIVANSGVWKTKYYTYNNGNVQEHHAGRTRNGKTKEQAVKSEIEEVFEV